MDKALESTFNNNKVIFRAEYIDGTIGLRPQNTVLHGAAIENQAQDTPGPFVLQANIHVSKEQNIAKDSTKLIRIQKAISVEDTDVRVVDFSKDQMISQHVTEQGLHNKSESGYVVSSFPGGKGRIRLARDP